MRVPVASLLQEKTPRKSGGLFPVLLQSLSLLPKQQMTLAEGHSTKMNSSIRILLCSRRRFLGPQTQSVNEAQLIHIIRI